MLRLSIVTVALALAGCAPGNICEERRETLTGARCVQSEDCPRSGDVGVCIQDTGNERPCVLCGAESAGAPETQCFLITPVSCT